MQLLSSMRSKRTPPDVARHSGCSFTELGVDSLPSLFRSLSIYLHCFIQWWRVPICNFSLAHCKTTPPMTPVCSLGWVNLRVYIGVMSLVPHSAPQLLVLYVFSLPPLLLTHTDIYIYKYMCIDNILAFFCLPCLAG